jgi:aminoglycoside N3'-acetyltransferase
VGTRPIPVETIAGQLAELGVTPGATLLVHTAFSRVGPVADGPAGLIAALQRALGPEGTLVMPSMTDDDEQPFDPLTTPCRHLGIVADTFWRQPDAMRSASPHAFAARGPHAARITAPHPIDFPHGPDSPVGRVYDLDGQVLLLGIDHTANTTIHLAEYLGGARYRRAKSAVALRDGHVVYIHYGEIDHCCQNFSLADAWLDAHGLQRRGRVGDAEARLVRSRDLVEVVVAQVRADETVFLHSKGVDEECDEARLSLAQ